jgi:hypothetical protein
MAKKPSIKIELTPEQKALLRQQTKQAVGEERSPAQLAAEALEDRAAPRGLGGSLGFSGDT